MTNDWILEYLFDEDAFLAETWSELRMECSYMGLDAHEHDDYERIHAKSERVRKLIEKRQRQLDTRIEREYAHLQEIYGELAMDQLAAVDERLTVLEEHILRARRD
jgi:hypothetical protein